MLRAGTFRVSDFRKNVPPHVKLQVLLDHVRAKLAADHVALHGGESLVPSWDAADLEFDHDPALVARDYDTKAGDFIPPQNDPAHLVIRSSAEHLQKTTGRRAGASRTVTTRGSDAGEAKRVRDIQATEAVHRAALASKDGRYRDAAQILASVKLKRKDRFKRTIPSRPFSRTQRPLHNGAKR